jgi:protein-S-isoprenylcysteine O-methyltransferase Ste14
MTGLEKQAAAGLGFLLVVMGAALFVTAGTIDYWQAWLFLAVFAISTSAITLYLAKRDPALLARRVKAGPVAEQQRKQQIIQSLASLAFLAVFVLCAFDHRRGAQLPVALELAGDALVAVGLFIVFRVFRANTFTAATIQVEREQTLVSTGPYGVVRHPMYSGALVMMLGVPLALGSWWGLVAVPPLAAVIVWRLLDEERQLTAELPGYAEYRAKVKSRLVPLVW